MVLSKRWQQWRMCLLTFNLLRNKLSFHSILNSRTQNLSTHTYIPSRASQVALVVKNTLANAGDMRHAGSIPGLGRSPGGGHGNRLKHSCLENPMERGAWLATVQGVAKNSDTTKATQHSTAHVSLHIFSLNLFQNSPLILKVLLQSITLCSDYSFIV